MKSCSNKKLNTFYECCLALTAIQQIQIYLNFSKLSPLNPDFLRLFECLFKQSLTFHLELRSQPHSMRRNLAERIFPYPKLNTIYGTKKLRDKSQQEDPFEMMMIKIITIFMILCSLFLLPLLIFLPTAINNIDNTVSVW